MAKTDPDQLSAEEQSFFDSGGQLDLLGGAERPPGEVVGEPPAEAPPGEEQPPAELPTEPGEPGAPAEPGEQGARPDTGYVPRKALVEERRLRQEMEARYNAREQELQQRRDVQARIEERLRMMQERRQAEEAAAAQHQAPLPDPDEDPFGYERAKREQLEQRISNHEAYLAQQAQVADQARQQNDYQQRAQAAMVAVQNQTQQFAARTPDYYDALRFIQQDRDQELGLMGYSQQQRAQIIQNEAGMIVAGAMSANQNPAENLYKMAQRRGFKGGNGGGAAPPSQSGNRRVDQLQRGMQASRTLSSTPGVESGAPTTYERLANVSEDEFARIIGKDPDIWEREMKRSY